MIKNFFLRLSTLMIVVFALPFMALAQTVGVFYDSGNEQMKFAAGDVKTALESKGLTVEMLALSTLNTTYANKKVVISLVTNTNVTSIFTSQLGTIPTGLGEQAYGLRTTTTPEKSYWIFGGDNNGAMYGGLQLAENITSDGFSKSYDELVSPDFKQRGVKLNLPFDKRIPTYSGFMNPTSAQFAIKNVWDMNFWKTWIDQQSRNRYNVLSVWVHHPFPALVKVPGYEKASLPGIEGYFGFADPSLTHEKRVAFWRQVMTYAHDRGFSFYFFCWNVCVEYAKDQYPSITDSETNTTTIDYLSKSMKSLLETYPELDGFGISAGDNMASPKDQRPAWTWKAYGKAAYDYAIANPDRKFTLIHRGLGTALTSVYKDWSPLTKLPNFKFDYSVKYANAHMFSTLTPRWYESDMADASSFNQKTWLTLRNDDFLYMDMGDPQFVRGFLNGVPNRNVINSFYIGSDIYMPTRTFWCKDISKNGQLEIQRNWYIQMLWGRIAYNKNISDDVFKKYMANRFPQVSSETLFNAWALASRSLPKMQELTQKTWNLDAHWYAEGSSYPCNGNTCYRKLDDFLTTEVATKSSSNLCSIAGSAAGTCGTMKTTYTLANEMEADAQSALALINVISSQGNSDLEVKINNIKQMSYLSNHFAYKIRAATYKKANQTENAKVAMGKAYCWWMKYVNSMDAIYNGNRFRTVDIKPDWHFVDALQLQDYKDLGGVGTPPLDCEGAATCTVTTITNGCAGSTVDITGSNNCGGSVTLTAKPAVNCNFVNFTDGTTTWTTNPLTVNVTANKQYAANFSGALQAPVADFTSDKTSVLVGGTVSFTDSSANTPTSWSWSFPGGTPATSTAQKPSVKYDAAGEYDVTLTSTNATGSNTKAKAKYVVVSKPAANVSSLTGWVAGTNNPKVSGSNRLLVVMVMGESSGDFAATSVTYGGQTMTKQTDRSYYVTSSRSYASIFTLNEAGLNLASNGTIVVNWNVIPTSGNSIYSTILSNVDQQTPVSAVSNNALTGTTVTIPSGLSAASGDMVVMCGATGGNVTQTFNNGFLKQFESNSTWGDGVGGYKIGNGQKETPSFTQSLSGRMVICALVAKKSASQSARISTDKLENASKNSFEIYPNPTSGILNVNFPNSDMSREIQIINTLGQKVYSVTTQNNHITIDVKALNLKGFIVVKVIAEDGVSNHKVLVK